MPRPTINNLNDYLHETLQQYDFCKGAGYFYFGYNQDAPENTPEPPVSMMIFALTQMDFREWKMQIDYAVENWLEVNA